MRATLRELPMEMASSGLSGRGYAAIAHLGMSDEKPTPGDCFLLVKVKGSEFAYDEADTGRTVRSGSATRGARAPLTGQAGSSAVRPSVGRDGFQRVISLANWEAAVRGNLAFGTELTYRGGFALD
jgi:hypothetical protein